MQRIALIGVGTMGSGLAANWLKAGFPLTVYNRNALKARDLESAGARLAQSPRAAAADADVVLSIVSDDRASRDVWLGEAGALVGARRGAIMIESSTVTPDWARELASSAASRGLRFLDAPVGGSRTAASSGKLQFFVGGDAETVEAARPALAAVSARVAHVGRVGAGATWKLVNNWLIAAQVATLAETLTFAERSGFDLRAVAPLILASSSASPIVQATLPRMLERRFDDPDFALALMHKDTRYAVAEASRAGLSLDMLRAAEAIFARAESRGLGDLDFSAVKA
jgi:3-hydroxyisobutyrate dehydrogenase